MTYQPVLRSRVHAALIVGAVASAIFMPGSLPAASAAPTGCQSTHAGDSDGDGRADPVVGVPGKNRVVLFHGSKRGIAPAGSIEGAAIGVADGLGEEVARGDVNADHCADAAVLVGSERVAILYAQADEGLRSAGAQLLDGAAMGYPLTCDCVRSLEAPTFGDFDGDGYDDLAVVVRDYWPDNDTDTVKLVVVPGSPGGVQPQDSRVLSLDGKEIPFRSRTLADPYLWLASGDVDADGRADLAVGIADRNVTPKGHHRGPIVHGDVATHPVVDVIYGSQGGLGQGRATQMWDRESEGVPGSDLSVGGFAVTFGRFNHDRYDDLALAIPYERAVVVLFGSASGLRPDGAAVVTLPVALVDSATRATAADFDADHDDELVMSAADNKKQQRIIVLRGTRHGLTTTGVRVWGPHTPGIPARRLLHGENSDLGSVLRSGFYGRGAGEDLLISDDRDAKNAGSVTELFGSRTHGLTTRHAVRITEAAGLVPGSPSAGDSFGA